MCFLKLLFYLIKAPNIGYTIVIKDYIKGLLNISKLPKILLFYF